MHGSSGSSSSAAEDNIQVAVPTTPAQYFHLLRRQVRRDFRKPLIVMTPKSLLRHKLAVSPVDHLTVGHFHDVLDDPASPDRVRRVLLCSGKVYYDLVAKRAEVGSQREVAIVRIEQLYPWPAEQLENGARAVPGGPRVGLGAGRVAKHGGVDVRGAAAPRAAWDRASSMSGETRVPARRPARSWSTIANRPRSPWRPSAARRCRTWSPPSSIRQRAAVPARPGVS